MMHGLLLGVLLLGVLLGLGQARSTHEAPDLAVEQSAWFGEMLGTYVVAGCVPPVPATGRTVTLPPCQAYAVRVSPARRMHYLDEPGPVALTVPGVPGPVWLIAHASVVEAVPGWTRQPGTHYLWQAAATQPALPDGGVWLAKLTVEATGTAVTLVEPLTATSPLPVGALESAVYATQYGLRCDGVTDNSAAFQAALAALPPNGGRLILPATGLPCRYSQTLTVLNNLWLQGSGGGMGGNTGSPTTVLEYTGAGVGIAVTGAAAGGTILEAFELRNRGTGTVGIDVDGAGFVKIRDVSLTFAVPWTQYGIRLGGTQNTHSSVLERVVVRDAAPVGLLVGYSQAYTRILNSRFNGNTDTQIQLGAANTAMSTHIVLTDFSAFGGSTGVLVMRAQGVFIDHSYCEIASNAYGVRIPDTAAMAEAVYVRHSRFNLLGGTNPIGVSTNFVAADLSVLENWFVLGGAGDPTAIVVQNALARTLRMIGNRQPGGTVVALTNYTNAIVQDNYQAGLGVTSDPVPQARCSTGIASGNQGGGEDPLTSCTIQANRLYRQAMSGVTIQAGGSVAANSNTKTYQLYIGGQLLYTTGAAAANNKDWYAECHGVRSDTGSGMFFACRGDWNGTPVPTQTTPGLTLGFGTALVVQPTATGVADGDITQRFLIVHTWP